MIAEVYEGINDHDAYRIAVSDNIMRKNLTDLELAHQVFFLRTKQNFGIDEIAAMHGFNNQRVYDLIKLTEMPAEIKQAVHTGAIKLYHAIELFKFPSAKRLNYMGRAIEERWSVDKIKYERRFLMNHPFRNFFPGKVLKRLEGKVHATRFIKNPKIERV